MSKPAEAALTKRGKPATDAERLLVLTELGWCVEKDKFGDKGFTATRTVHHITKPYEHLSACILEALRIEAEFQA